MEFSFFRYGRYNTVRQLLDSEKGTFIINESDGEGLTPLHIASQQGKKVYDVQFYTSSSNLTKPTQLI
jgi:ankyrin repeat protein